MARDFKADKAAKQAAYETACRTPGTPEHTARMRKLNDRTRELERDEINRRRTLRREIAATSLAEQRRVIDAVLNMQARNKV